ncbi:MAG TPA: MBL fold metallo-hydrolase [Anaerohalosphaeraceae bacterium]|jgi:hydroxyacylglutathione hydrolase|nr:MBL fold metallo-hydrolase [Anaerohalosphaeraceae bacterium]HRT48899.1 MBL fold metallo-hydrolase [Anaerohalosphaeraceae bacterium]HRT85022.1 MBL fold metallo-hydrolase [Anaerohalosphaeraceae bacterium]
MKVDTVVLGDFETNCYVVRAQAEAADCVVIDPGLAAEELLAFLEAQGARPAAVLLTHGHVDHIAGVEAVRGRYPGVVTVVHAADAAALENPVANLSMMLGRAVTARPAEVVVKEEGPVEYAGVRFDVLHTPGHTAGGVCFYSAQAGVVFAGDALFAGSIGRTDFPGGNYGQLIESIRGKLLVLPDETVVYPGHGPATTIGQERRSNQYLIDR